MNKKAVSRRRFISLSASVCASLSLPAAVLADTQGRIKPFSWQGQVLGGHATLQFLAEDEREASRYVAICLGEIKRLEQVFSLHIPHSSIRELNKAGSLENAPKELIEVVNTALRLGAESEGYFDISIQPLWQYMMFTPESSLDSERLTALAKLVDYRNIETDADAIRFTRPGMAISLNAVAQGYITDCVSKKLRAAGLHNVLVQLGETYAQGSAPSGGPWRIGIPNPQTQDIVQDCALENRAIATSSKHGSEFSGKHHLLNPHAATAHSPYESVSVLFKKASLADALSTALCLIPASSQAALLAKYPGAQCYVQTESQNYWI